MKFALGLALILSFPVLAKVSPKINSYRKYDDVIVSRFTSTSWKLLPVTHRKTTIEGAIDCDLLGDGWHLPSEIDWKTDFDDLSKSAISTTLDGEKFWLSNAEERGGKIVHYRAGNFLNKQVVRVDASKTSMLPTACVCGPSVTHVESRRTKKRCAGFRDGHQSIAETHVLNVDAQKKPKVETLQEAKMACAKMGMRLPIFSELLSRKTKLAEDLLSRGCVWSASPADDDRILVYTFENLYGVTGKGKADPSRVTCYTACVL